MTRQDYAREVRAALADPTKLCAGLGWLEGSKRQAKGISIRCPSHGERHPSCSVTTGPDGTVRVRCFACQWSGDALTLVAHRYGLDLREDFREILAVGAELGGHHALAHEIRQGKTAVNRPRVESPEPSPPAVYPPREDVETLWGACIPVAEDTDASGALVQRRIDPLAVDAGRLARVIPRSARAPRWGAFQGRNWSDTGHRLIVRAWDHTGAFRSVRAWRVTPGETPKRLPPAGHRAAELVLANRLAVGMLLGIHRPRRVVVTEGEPDWLVASLAWPADAVIGLGSGSWPSDEGGRRFAARVPEGAEVVIRTHDDIAGEKYAAAVAETLEYKCVIWRAVE